MLHSRFTSQEVEGGETRKSFEGRREATVAGVKTYQAELRRGKEEGRQRRKRGLHGFYSHRCNGTDVLSHIVLKPFNFGKKIVKILDFFFF